MYQLNQTKISFRAAPQLLITVIIWLGCYSCGNNHNSAATKQPQLTNEMLPEGFTAKTVLINGRKFYYREGGHGPVLLLLHGFPEDGSAYSKIMKLALARYRLIVPDLKGIGRSSGGGSYDAQTIAQDLHLLLKLLNVSRTYIVGHDMSGNIAYTFAHLYPQMTRGVILAEAPLSGLDPWNEISAKVWHIPFQESDLVPEILIRGREREYFKAQFFSQNGIPSDSITEKQLIDYSNAYSSLNQLQAGLGLYRAVKVNSAFNLSHKEKIFVPITIVNGQNSLGTFTLRQVASIRNHGAVDVSYNIIDHGMHYLADEKPDDLYKIIREKFSER